MIASIVKWTPRFQENFHRYNGISEFVVKKTAELLKRVNSNPDTWHFHLEKLKDDSLSGVAAYRLKVTSGDRLIFVLKGSDIVLVDIGDHEVMEEYSRMNRAARDGDLLRATPVDGSFKRQLEVASSATGRPTFRRTKSNLVDLLETSLENEESRWLYEEELSEEWITFLDDEQFQVSKGLFEKLVSPNETMSVEFIMGGPGTGKTVVLLNLAVNLAQAGRAVSFSATENVIKYLSSGGRVVPGANLGFGPGVVALIDDPASSKELAGLVRRAKSAGCRAIVVGFDPLQWHERKMESNFRKVCENFTYNFYALRICYRQTSGVGQRTIELTEKIYNSSSRYLDSLKQVTEREELQPYIDLSLGMTFVDESGRFVIHVSEVMRRYSDEIKRFRARIDRWQHTSPIAFIYDDDLPKEFLKTLKAEAAGLNRSEIPLSKYRQIRGVEFQELFLFVTSKFWTELNEGKTGVGAEEWEKMVCLHTILSRPKDSLVVFVLAQS